MNPDIEKFVRHPLAKWDDLSLLEKQRGKKPILNEWQTLEKTPDNMQEYIDKGFNQGAVCGKASGFTAIDLDHELFVNDLFNGFDLNTLRSARTPGRGHVYFKYNDVLPSSKHHDLGIEILNDGSNIVIPPSKHRSGQVYNWIDPDAPIMKMPEKLIGNWEKLRTTEAELKQFIAKCRHCFRDVLKKHPDMHGADGREYMLAVCTDLKAAGAVESHVKMFAKLMYGKDYNEARTLQEWRNIDASKTWKCETIKAKLPSYIDFFECDKCDKRRDNYKGNAKTPTEKTKKELPTIPHEEIDTAPYDINNHLTSFKKWLAIKEDYNIIAPVCAFIGNFVPGESDIIGIISPSGSTKTEIIRSFGEHENQYSYPISSMTEHTLVSGHEDNIDTIPILRNRVMLIKDLTSVLAKKEDVRSAIFADFREITDGHIRKEFGNGIKKEYLNIHSSILFGSTNAIERYYSMYSNLGQRMVFIRPHNDPKDARRQSEKNRNSLDQMRKELHESTMRMIFNSLKIIKEKGASKIPDDLKEDIGSLCDFLALVRTTIHHDVRGDMDEIPEPEFPTRVYNTICKLTEVHASLNGRLTANEDDKRFALRLIADNIPTTRLQILQHLTPEEQTTVQISKKAELPTSTGKRILDDLASLHLVVKVPREMKGESSDDRRSDSFYVSDETSTVLEQLKGVIMSGCIENDQLTYCYVDNRKKFNILNKNGLTQDNRYPLESHPSIIDNSVTEPSKTLFQDFGMRAKDWQMMNSKNITDETKIEASLWIAQSLKKLNVNPSDVLRYLELEYKLTPEARS